MPLSNSKEYNERERRDTFALLFEGLTDGENTNINISQRGIEGLSNSLQGEQWRSSLTIQREGRGKKRVKHCIKRMKEGRNGVNSIQKRGTL